MKEITARDLVLLKYQEAQRKKERDKKSLPARREAANLTFERWRHWKAILAELREAERRG